MVSVNSDENVPTFTRLGNIPPEALNRTVLPEIVSSVECMTLSSCRCLQGTARQTIPLSSVRDETHEGCAANFVTV